MVVCTFYRAAVAGASPRCGAAACEFCADLWGSATSSSASSAPCSGPAAAGGGAAAGATGWGPGCARSAAGRKASRRPAAAAPSTGSSSRGHCIVYVNDISGRCCCTVCLYTMSHALINHTSMLSLAAIGQRDSTQHCALKAKLDVPNCISAHVMVHRTVDWCTWRWCELVSVAPQLSSERMRPPLPGLRDIGSSCTTAVSLSQPTPSRNAVLLVFQCYGQRSGQHALGLLLEYTKTTGGTR